MATLHQIAANRKNSKKSTGPRTVGGKRMSSRNASKTGVYSRQTLLPEEDALVFTRLRTEYYREWSPLGPTEELLVERLVVLAWRIARYSRTESGMIDALRRLPRGVGGIPAAYLRDARGGDSLGRLVSMEAATFKSCIATISALEKLQQTRVRRAAAAPPFPQPRTGNQPCPEIPPDPT